LQHVFKQKPTNKLVLHQDMMAREQRVFREVHQKKKQGEETSLNKKKKFDVESSKRTNEEFIKFYCGHLNPFFCAFSNRFSYVKLALLAS
jgi:hypothetical protein